jgi:hypothetical protein
MSSKSIDIITKSPTAKTKPSFQNIINIEHEKVKSNEKIRMRAKSHSLTKSNSKSKISNNEVLHQREKR